jgi:hypothetical protein
MHAEYSSPRQGTKLSPRAATASPSRLAVCWASGSARGSGGVARAERSRDPVSPNHGGITIRRCKLEASGGVIVSLDHADATRRYSANAPGHLGRSGIRRCFESAFGFRGGHNDARLSKHVKTRSRPRNPLAGSRSRPAMRPPACRCELQVYVGGSAPVASRACESSGQHYSPTNSESKNPASFLMIRRLEARSSDTRGARRRAGARSLGKIREIYKPFR